MKETSTAPKKSVVIALLAISAALILGFAFLLRTSLRKAEYINPADYTETLDNFTYVCDITHEGGAAVFSGFAAIEGERFQSVDTSVVLYSAEDDTYLKIPTIMTDRPDARDAIADGINYAFGGYYAFVTDAQLKYPLEGYELCFAYRCNAHNALVHTGVNAEVTS